MIRTWGMGFRSSPPASPSDWRPGREPKATQWYCTIAPVGRCGCGLSTYMPLCVSGSLWCLIACSLVQYRYVPLISVWYKCVFSLWCMYVCNSFGQSVKICVCVCVCILLSSNEDLHQWMSAFDTAIKEHREKTQSRKSIREQLNPVSNHVTIMWHHMTRGWFWLQDGGEEERIPLGHLAPPWLPDSAVSMCQLCSVQFTVTRRRHHCRACGQVRPYITTGSCCW